MPGNQRKSQSTSSRIMSHPVRLTDLPAEMLLEIMCQLPDASHLLNVVRACSCLHDVYKSNREEILARMLNRIINIQNGVALEADACLNAISPDPHAPHPPDLNDFLAKWRTRRAEQLALDQDFQDRRHVVFYPENDKLTCITKEVSPAPLGKWPIRDFDHLVRLYKQHLLIRRCVHEFCKTTLAESSKSSLTKPQQDLRKKFLSYSERRRLYRAFYRFHLYDKLYIYKEWELHYKFLPAIWLCTFPPHECEEMATVYQWLDDGWEQMFGQLDRETSWTYQEERMKYVDLGLETFLEARQKRDKTELQAMASKFDTDLSLASDAVSIGECLYCSTPFRGTSWGTDGVTDGFPISGTDLNFQNDHPDCPNHGWLWSFNYQMSNHFYHFSHCDLRRIGHVMWDRDRLDSWEIYQKPPPRLLRGNWANEGGPYPHIDDSDSE